MTIFNEGRHAIRALGAALAATAVCMKNYFVHGLTRTEGIPLGIMPDRRIAGSPDRRIAGSPDRASCIFMAPPPKALRLPA